EDRIGRGGRVESTFQRYCRAALSVVADSTKISARQVTNYKERTIRIGKSFYLLKNCESFAGHFEAYAAGLFGDHLRVTSVWRRLPRPHSVYGVEHDQNASQRSRAY